ncbi:MAG: chemotaxis protein CheD [Chitinispirillaceae bacterium]|nr:chemotaxis protein CheD [Chitinispirillaceae bacterium]
MVITGSPDWRLKNVEDVQTGEMKAGYADTVLVSNAIGSCIALICIDSEKPVGGIAHIMLPGRAPSGITDAPITRYAENGFNALFDMIRRLGGARENMHICVAGAANVLMDTDDTICRDNVKSVLRLCSSAGFTVEAQSIGGFKRRSVCLDVETCCVFCAIGDEPEFMLWSASKE